MERAARGPARRAPQEISAGELTIDAGGYTARLRGRPLDLTYKEFELLKYLVQHPGRVFTRAQLLQEVWGYDYYGGTRTVDVHVRRLRAKLGPEHEQLIGTVRNVGYRFDPPKERPVEEVPAAPVSSPVGLRRPAARERRRGPGREQRCGDGHEAHGRLREAPPGREWRRRATERRADKAPSA